MRVIGKISFPWAPMDQAAEFINNMFRPKILQVFSVSDYMEKRRDQFPLGYKGLSQVAQW